MTTGAPTHPPPLGYKLVSALCRFLLNLFYLRIDVVGAERIPESAPLIVAANHHNSLVDAMMLVAFFPRRLRTLANAPLFKNPLIGPFLRVMGALPVKRRQEAGNDPARNTALFAETTAALRVGGSIMLFPEGRTQPEPVLLELRTGAARMLLAAQAAGPLAAPVVLLPVGLVFHAPGTFREGRALVLVGMPVDTADCIRLAQTDPEGAGRQLTDRLATSLRGLIVEADDRESLRLLTFVEELWSEVAGLAARDGRERVAWLQRVMRAHRLLLDRFPDRVAELRGRLAEGALEMEQAGLSTALVSRTYTRASVLGFAIRQGFSLLAGAPLALCGIAIHLLPYKLTGAVVARILRDDEEEATDKLATGFVFFPLLWVLEGAFVFTLAGPWAAVVFAVALFPLGFFAVAWRERLDRAARESAAFLRHLRDPGLASRLRDRRQTLVHELTDLAKLVPEVWAD